jgi:DNA phosphorothioation system restriction enzyme
MFQNLCISNNYESIKENNIVQEFYLPVLASTKIYKRTVGFFSTDTLILAAKGIKELIDNEGEYQLIASPIIDDEDLEKLKTSQISHINLIEEILIRSLSSPNDLFSKARLNVLATLIENNQLELKIAIPREYLFKGIHYERLGIMEDSEGEKITFSSQINYTSGEYFMNYETIDVFCSWKQNENEGVNNKIERFNKLWDGHNELYYVINIPDSIKKLLVSFKDTLESLTEPEIPSIEKCIQETEIYPSIPSNILLREYQQEAVRNWFRNNCQGLFEMATGTGKTITALSAVVKLWEVTKRLGVIIVCPYTHLVDQWVKDIKQFGMSPIVAYQSKSFWEASLFSEVSTFQSGITNHFCVITTVSTFTSEAMQNILKKLSSDALFIADEAHHLGAKKNREKLIPNFQYRLALSATPNRWHDEAGTEELVEYFGNSIVFQFGLEKAIGEHLTEYHYFPHIVYLESDESEYYYEITKKIAKMYFQNVTIEENESLQFLLIERSRILSRARNKLVILEELMKGRIDSKYNIIYCGDSRVDGEKQIDAVVKLLGNELNMKVHTFTSRENKEERQELLNRFESGDLQALVAIKCLDEGVDIPATQTAYILSSSTNPREFIQRRGRVLRKHKNKQFSYIHDFIVLPRKLDEIQLVESSVFNTERNMIKRELKRFSEFADLAINGPLAHEKLNELKLAYHLLDI